MQDLGYVRAVLDTVDFSPKVKAISPSRVRGSKAYPHLPKIRALLSGYLAKPRIESATALHWALANARMSAASMTGFPTVRPSPEFSPRWRIIRTSWMILARRPLSVCSKSYRALADEIAADSTTVPSYSSPDPDPNCDQDAT